MPVSEAIQEPVIVFVVEDELLLKELFAPSLEEAGYSILEAVSGEEALRVLEGPRGQDIRALVTDINLGGEVTGWDVARRAREITPGLPVVYLTGQSAEEWSANGVPNSVLISKPFAPGQVVTAVSQLLNTSATIPPA
jgi:DNA-binding response OmpR family regulator